MNIYLTGGTSMGWWTELVSPKIEGISFYSSSKIGGIHPNKTDEMRNLQGKVELGHCDLLVLYLEDNNEHVESNAYFAGYAQAAGMPIIVVDLSSPDKHHIAKKNASVAVNSLADARMCIEMLTGWAM